MGEEHRTRVAIGADGFTVHAGCVPWLLRLLADRIEADLVGAGTAAELEAYDRQLRIRLAAVQAQEQN
jgi:hypothetical protein